MRIKLIKPGMGEVIEGYDINDGSMEPLSLAIIAALIPKQHEVCLYDDRLEKIPFNEPTDLVFITVDSFTARRAYQISKKYRELGSKVVLGGVHPTLLPEEAAEYADSVVIGDIEPVIGTLLHDAQNECLKTTYQGSFGIPQDNCFPDRSVFKGKNYLPVSLVQFSRGCKYNCSYCSVSKFFNKSHKLRRIEDVLTEIEKDKLKTILFVDDNMVSDRENLKLFLKELIPLKVKWASQSSIEMTNDRELMELMAKSGCIGHLIGFESIDVNTLKWFNKGVNLRNFDNYAKALEVLRDYGLQTWASFMIGNDFDTPESIERTVEYAIKSKFTLAFFHVLMPYPGTQIYEQFRSEDRLLFEDKWWSHPDFRYNDATFKPKLMTPEQLKLSAVKANKDFYAFSSIISRFLDSKTNMRSLVKMMVYLKFNMVLRKTST